jgi:HD superfamily phosphodiesterase
MERLKMIESVLSREIAARPLIPGKDNQRISHEELAHAYGVSLLCRLLARKRRLDEELGAIIGYLHDIGRIRLNILTRDHAYRGSVEARAILEDLGVFDHEEIGIVVSAIEKHDDKERIDNDYDELIKDADSLERSYHYPNSQRQGLREERKLKVLAELGIA